MGQEGAKNAPSVGRPRKNPRSGRRGNVVISIFKRQGFRLLDRDHFRIGFAGNDRHGAFMMVTRRAERIELAPYALAPSGHAAVALPSSVMSSRPLQLAARNLLLDRANAAIRASRIGSPAMGGAAVAASVASGAAAAVA